MDHVSTDTCPFTLPSYSTTNCDWVDNNIPISVFEVTTAGKGAGRGGEASYPQGLINGGCPYLPIIFLIIRPQGFRYLNYDRKAQPRGTTT